MAIRFYSHILEYGAFSNFAITPIDLDGATWPTVEHYFQAQKFHDDAYREAIRTAATPKEAKRLGRTRKFSLRDDWETVKDAIMLRAVRAKFEAHPASRELLLGTGEEELIEAAPVDYYWGAGRTGSGRNRLGEILMQARAELRVARGEGSLTGSPKAETGSAALEANQVESLTPPSTPASPQGAARRGR